MGHKERLLRTLFESEGRKHLNIKFARGTSDDISAEELCAEANSALLQVKLGHVERRELFGDKDEPTVDVTNI